jgi:uncharacterized membrane protein YbhN (UPF0104 family)
MKKRTFDLVKFLVSATLLILIFTKFVDLEALLNKLQQAKWHYLFIAAILMIVGTALRAVRWDMLLRPLEIRVPLPRLIYFYFVGSFFNIFLPTGVGGDVVKMAMLGQETDRKPEAVGTTLVDRATGLWVLFIISLLALPFSYQLLPPIWIAPIILITVGGAIGGFLVMGTPLLPWIGSKIRLPGQDQLERFYRSVSQLGYKALALASSISLIFDILLIIFNFLIARSLNVNLPFAIFILFTPLISLSLALPVSIAGLGAREATYIALYGAVGVTPETAIAMSLFDYLITNIIIGLIGGGLFAIKSFIDFLHR